TVAHPPAHAAGAKASSPSIAISTRRTATPFLEHPPYTAPRPEVPALKGSDPLSHPDSRGLTPSARAWHIRGVRPPLTRFGSRKPDRAPRVVKGGQTPFRRGRLGRVRTVVAIGLALPWVVWALVRTLGVEVGYPLVALLAFTPYAALTSPLP